MLVILSGVAGAGKDTVKKEIIKRNLLAGVFRGIGIGIGITIISAMIIYFLQRLIRLNIPVIGDYIGDIVSIVQKNL